MPLPPCLAFVVVDHRPGAQDPVLGRVHARAEPTGNGLGPTLRWLLAHATLLRFAMVVSRICTTATCLSLDSLVLPTPSVGPDPRIEVYLIDADASRTGALGEDLARGH